MFESFVWDRTTSKKKRSKFSRTFFFCLFLFLASSAISIFHFLQTCIYTAAAFELLTRPTHIAIIYICTRTYQKKKSVRLAKLPTGPFHQKATCALHFIKKKEERKCSKNKLCTLTRTVLVHYALQYSPSRRQLTVLCCVSARGTKRKSYENELYKINL